MTSVRRAVRARPDPASTRSGRTTWGSRASAAARSADPDGAAGPATRPVTRHGPDVPVPRSGSPPASTRTPSASTPWPRSGFGHVEVGTVTGEPQPGNPRPRLFRLPADRALVNRMGFNNDGAEAVAGQARATSEASPAQPVVLGVNIGKTKVVPEDDEAAVLADYTKSARAARAATPTTWSSTSARPTPPACATSRPWTGCGPLLEAVRRRRPTVPLARQDRPRPRRRRRGRRGRPRARARARRHHRHQHHDQPRGLGTPAAEVEAVGAGGLSGAPVAERSLEVLRLLHADGRATTSPWSSSAASPPPRTPARGSRPAPPWSRATPRSSTAARWWPRRIARRPRPTTGVPA